MDKIVSINPATEKINKTYDAYTSSQVEAILKIAQDSFSKWKDITFSQRSKLFNILAKNLKSKKNEYAMLITKEMGKTLQSAVSEIEKCAWVCEYFAQNAHTFLADEKIPTEAERSYLIFQPLGVIFAIMPWNFPFWQVFRFAAPAVMAGNVVILKHASNVPMCSLTIEKIFLESGFPKGIFQSLLIPAKNVESVIENPIIKAVTLTGSSKAGSNVAEVSGRVIKKTVLELGGSDPFIVLDDANIEKAAIAATASRLTTSGQSCIAAKRFIVQEKIAEDFISKLKQNFEKIRVGNPEDLHTDMGPLSSRQILEKLDNQIKESIKLGAKLIMGGKPLSKMGFFYPPTIVINVKKGMPIFNEETFGPVAPVIVAKDDEEMLSTANDTAYGLGASIWTENARRAEKFISKIQTGLVFVNDIVRSDPRLPFGGIKQSGYGWELSSYGIKEFVNIKAVWREQI
jgi:succinate-semialdehyde dehydrogenase/glutarate-semialdehyde dehydrogenase